MAIKVERFGLLGCFGQALPKSTRATLAKVFECSAEPANFVERGKNRLVMPAVPCGRLLGNCLTTNGGTGGGLTALGRPQAASLFRGVCKQIRSSARVLSEGSTARPGYRP
jgi:hypothetical protein